MKKPDTSVIYNTQANQYDCLISREDYKGNILKTLKSIVSFEGKDIIDLGAGTGRLACMLAPIARSIIAFDISQAMLDVAGKKLRKSGCANWRVEVADHRSIPVSDQDADIVVSGWSIFYLGRSDIPNWESNTERVISEIKRVLRPNGTIILFETLGTGNERPEPPSILTGYYRRLEEHYGFKHQWIRTDYQFETLAEAEELTRFFFGDDLADRVVNEKMLILPECTGVWWMEKES